MRRNYPGYTPPSKAQLALERYQDEVMRELEKELAGADALGKQMRPEIADTLVKLTAWIAQEQQKAFEHGASAKECAKWMASEIRALRARANAVKPH